MGNCICWEYWVLGFGHILSTYKNLDIHIGNIGYWGLLIFYLHIKT